MTEVEQALTALIIDKARQLESNKFRGPLSLLRADTEGSYGLDKYAGAFEAALEFLESHNLAKIHRYAGVEDHLSIDIEGTLQRVRLNSLAAGESRGGNPFSFDDPDPDYPIIATYLDVGSGWLHDFALSLRNDENEGATKPIFSASWTGRYVVSEEDRVRFAALIVQMRDQIENMELSNAERSNALAALDAIKSLSEAADPAWSLILKILRSPILANVTALVALAVSMIK